MTPSISIERENAERCLKPSELLPEQISGVLNACESCLSLISGGPGTGKTYTAGELVRVVWELLPLEMRDRYKIALAAPTGKAASNLQQSLTRATERVESFPTLKAKTLHSLLGIRENDDEDRDADAVILVEDLIIVDESSMIDVKMMRHLLKAIKPGARLVLLGDKDQLPPVEAGGLFADLINAVSERATVLNRCLRSELQGIVELSRAINQGNVQEVQDLLDQSAEGIERRPHDLEENLQEIVTYFPYLDPERTRPEVLLESFQKFRVLSPLRQGPWGVEALNLAIAKRWKQRIGTREWMAMPIMITKNDRSSGLVNGEVGVLVTRSGMPHYAFFQGREVVDAVLLPPYEVAFCMSVHKSQGSEFDTVWLVVPEGSEKFGKELVYTGVTRARKKIIISSLEEILVGVLGKSSRRFSSLSM